MTFFYSLTRTLIYSLVNIRNNTVLEWFRYKKETDAFIGKTIRHINNANNLTCHIKMGLYVRPKVESNKCRLTCLRFVCIRLIRHLYGEPVELSAVVCLNWWTAVVCSQPVFYGRQENWWASRSKKNVVCRKKNLFTERNTETTAGKTPLPSTRNSYEGLKLLLNSHTMPVPLHGTAQITS